MACGRKAAEKKSISKKILEEDLIYIHKKITKNFLKKNILLLCSSGFWVYFEKYLSKYLENLELKTISRRY